MSGQREGDRLGQGHTPFLAALGRAEDRLGASDELDLPDNVDRAPEEVDVFEGQAEDLALPKTAPRAQGHRFSAMIRSSTAAVNTADTLAKIDRR
ncbi:hypothetical protein ACQPXS_13840 [Streptomyces sp. CA-142005]|uniref:hypothetical protein n=1 Tax=Streptomyces sp. CA-142005 TaxID=3240052 RepID=UPI003D8F75D7